MTRNGYRKLRGFDDLTQTQIFVFPSQYPLNGDDKRLRTREIVKSPPDYHNPSTTRK
jgi:hypothetical protein